MAEPIYQALLDWNPWLFQDFPDELTGFSRDYNLLEYLHVPEIKIIEGARRVGKSTLLYQVIKYVLDGGSKNVLYINFEDETLKNYSLSNIFYEYLSHSHIDYLFVDEIQNCDNWVEFIRAIYDRREVKQIWISGSNSSFIKKEYATLLTGRNLSIHIAPLSFHEFLTFKGFGISPSFTKRQQATIMKYFTEYCEYGAFPAVVNRHVLKKELLTAYFDDFLYKDIVARYNTNPSKIKELASYLASNSGKSFSYRNLANAMSCHPNTIMDYLGYLKDTFLFDELYKFDYSLQKQFINDKKIYCLDTGLASAVSFKFSNDYGRILENVVFRELYRRKCDIYFHKTNVECDFIVKKDLEITQAIQVCATLIDPETKTREVAGLLNALQIYNLQQGYILTLAESADEEIIFNSKAYLIKIIPVWQWLLEY